MNRHHIKAVMYKQFCDTLKNKLLLLLIFMYPVLAYIFYFLLKDTQEAVNIVIPIFITMHIIMAPIVCMSSIISEEKEKNTIKVLLFSGIRSYEYLLGVAGVLMGILIVSVIPYSFMGEMKTDIGIDTGVCVANMAVLILVFCFVYTKSGKMSQ